MPWTIEHDGGTHDFAFLGFTGLRRTLVNQGIDVAAWDAPVDAIETTPVIAPLSSVIIRRPDGVKWFQGVVTQTPLTALPDSETHGYVVSGPWWHLEENVMKMPWYTNGGPFMIGHLLLNIDINNALVPTNTQIENVLNYVLSLFPGDPPFQVGSIEPEAYPMATEVNAVTAASIIRGQLRWAPDAVAWFDYSTEPPTFHVKQRASLTARNIALPGSAGMRLVPRHDLVRPSVSIHFETTINVDGVDYVSVEFDTAPSGATGQEPRCLNLAMNLQGPIINRTSAALLCEEIDPSSLDWWKVHHQPFRDPRYANFAISGLERSLQDGTPSSAYLNELIEGQIAPWMSFAHEQEVITAKITYDFYDRDPLLAGAVKLVAAIDQDIRVSLVATNATSGTYGFSVASDTGDPRPVGMAQFLYDAVSVLHYDGTINLVEREVTGAAAMGDVVNITGGRAEWASMNAVVQQVSEDADNGATQITIGPPKHLGPDDLMELLRVGRRVRWTAGLPPDGGALNNGDAIQFGKPTANRDTNPGKEQTQLLNIMEGENQIILDATDKSITMKEEDVEKVLLYLGHIVAAYAGALPVKLRETVICELVDGVPVQKKALVFRSGTIAI